MTIARMPVITNLIASKFNMWMFVYEEKQNKDIKTVEKMRRVLKKAEVFEDIACFLLPENFVTLWELLWKDGYDY